MLCRSTTSSLIHTRAHSRRARASLVRPSSSSSSPAVRSAPRARPRRAGRRLSKVLIRASAYDTWLKENDVQGDAVRITNQSVDDAETMRTTTATRAIRADDALVRLPRKAALCVLEGEANPIEDFVTDALWDDIGDAKWTLRLALVLLRERKLGAESAFCAYVEQLPRRYDLIGSYSDEEVRAMQYPLSGKMAREQRDENAEAIRLVRKHAATGGALAATSDEEIVWALDTVRSRVFSGRLVDSDKLRAKLLPRSLAVGMCFLTFMTASSAEGRWLAVFAVLALTVFDSTSNTERDSKTAYVLMPLIDAFNHKTMIKTEFEFDRGAFVLRAPKDYETGEEVLISYGVLNNDELITRYGFVDVDNVADIYRFEGLMSYLQASYDPMKRALGADQKRLSTLKRTHPELDQALWEGNFISDGNADPKLLWALRTVLATPEEYAAAKGVDGFKLGGGAPERRAADAIRAAVESRLAEYPTTIEEDEEALKTANGNERTAIQYRIRKKRILRDASRIYKTS